MAVIVLGVGLGVGTGQLLRSDSGEGAGALGAAREPDAPGSPNTPSEADTPGDPGAHASAADLDPNGVEIRHASVSVSGDILVHQPVWSNALANGGGGRYDFLPMFEAVRPLVAGADLAICHLETPITSGEPSGYPLFSSPPDLVASIARAGWDACSTASNHALDMGMPGIRQTVEAFRSHGLAQTGSHRSSRQSRRPVILDAGNLSLALLSYTDHTNGIPPPEQWSVGVLPAGDPAVEKARRVAADARRAVQAGADAVLVAIQWGEEYATSPNASQMDLARRLVRIPEILAIAGQGPHTVQPIERVTGKPVIYSSGNLLSNQSAFAGLPAESQYGLIGVLRLAWVEGDPDRLSARQRHLLCGGSRSGMDGSSESCPGAVASGGRLVSVTGVDYVPTWVRLTDHLVEPVGWGLEHDPANGEALRQAWESTVGIAGRSPDIGPLPRRLPPE